VVSLGWAAWNGPSSSHLLVGRGLVLGSESQQGLESRHRLLAPIMAKDEVIKISLELMAAHAVRGSEQPLLQVADGAVGQRQRGLCAFVQVRSLDKFLRRYLLHILPQGFVRIRHFGFLATRRRATLLPLCFHYLGTAPEPQAEQHLASTEDALGLWRYPKCGGPMKVVERLTPAEIQLRSPPLVTAAA
jgi:hypothetical protein